jgi:hypothetical protein
MNMNNQYRIDKDKVYIGLRYKNQMMETIIDLNDLERVSLVNWRATYDNRSGSFYVTGYYKGYHKTMHRYLFDLSIGDERVIDHMNHNTLDNTRANLIITDTQGNNWNKGRAHSTNTTGIRGVTLSGKKYQAQVKYKGQTVIREYYYTLMEATMAVIACRNRINNRPVRIPI